MVAKALRLSRTERCSCRFAGQCDWRAARARENSKYIAITAHMDTVFPAATKIDARREGDKLFGPGISDNGAGLTAMLALVSALQAAKLRTEAPLSLLPMWARKAKAMFAGCDICSLNLRGATRSDTP